MRTRGLRDVGLGDAGTWDAGTPGHGTQGHGTRGLRDWRCGTRKRWDSGKWDINKQHLQFSVLSRKVLYCGGNVAEWLRVSDLKSVGRGLNLILTAS